MEKKKSYLKKRRIKKRKTFKTASEGLEHPAPLSSLILGTLRYDDGKPLRRQRKDGKNWVEVAVLARNLGCYEVSKTATSKHKHSP